MIEYVEIRNSARDLIGIIDTFDSLIWHTEYYGTGDFEIYVPFSDEISNILKENNFVTRPDDDNIGIIEHINITFDAQKGYMIAADGRFCKSILERRLIFDISGHYNRPVIVQGKVETAVRNLVKNNCITATESARNFSFLELGALGGFPNIIVDGEGEDETKQANFQNLLDYSSTLLDEYDMSCKVIFNADTQKLQFVVFKGTDRTEDSNSPVVFSQDRDNLNESSYDLNNTAERTAAIIGGDGEENDRYYAILSSSSGLNRREIFVDAKQTTQIMKDSTLLEVFLNGVFYDDIFRVGGTQAAKLIVEEEIELTLAEARTQISNTLSIKGLGQFIGRLNDQDHPGILNYTIYGTKIFGSDVPEEEGGEAPPAKYRLNPLGYRRWLTAQNREGNYRIAEASYIKLLKAQGQTALTPLRKVETFSGEIDIQKSMYKLNVDYFLGDVITIHDIKLDKSADVRITEITEVQDENGYKVDINYQ